jgi:hypothetical protein
LPGQDPPPVPPAGGKPPELTEEQKRIVELFSATKESFKDGRLILEYNFESQQKDLADDWEPAIDKSRDRVRWARGIEGTPSTIEHGIIVSDQGQWMHKAEFLNDIEVKVDMMSVASYRSGTLLGPVFYNAKKKMAIGSCGGNQLVCLKGLSHAKAPHPREERPIQANSRQVIGYKYRGGVFESYFGTRKTADSTDLKKFTEGYDTGRPGLAWKGSVQCFVYKVTIEGKLDPAWVAKQLKK